MLCDVCKCNDATVFLTQILEGKMQKVNLCDACSIEKGASTQKCPVCGFSQADFKKTGRLGCSACYVTFAEGLGGLLKAMHKGTEHVGKLPERAQRDMKLNHRMRALNENLQKAVAEEKYETAASLRDQIKQLESDLSNSP